jgi:hypothetical protein
MREIALGSTIWLFQVADWALSRWSIEGGLAVEINPLVAWVVSHANGWTALLAFKTVCAILIFILLVLVKAGGSRRISLMVLLIAAFPIVWNVAGLLLGSLR